MTDQELFRELRSWFLDTLRPAATYHPEEFARVRRLLDEIDDYNVRQLEIVQTPTDERPISNAELLARLADWFLSIVTDPSRLTADETVEAYALSPQVARFFTQAHGGAQDVRVHLKPSRN